MKKGIKVVLGLIVLVIVLVSLIGFRYSGNGLRATVYTPVSTPINPALYYEFDGTLAKSPVLGSTTFGSGSASEYTVKTGGPNGNYISTTESNDTNVVIGSANVLNNSNAISISFNMRINDMSHDYSLMSANNFDISFWMGKKDGANSVPKIVFYTWHNSGVDAMVIDLDGVGPKSIDYYMDGNWHNFVYVFDKNLATNNKQIWIDGVLPNGFTQNVNSPLTVGSGNIYFNHWQNAYHLNGDIDSIAFYNQAIPGNLIYQMAQDISSATQKLNYSSTTTLETIPNAPAVYANLDQNDYLPDTELSTSAYWTSPKSGKSFPNALTQIKNIPLPRYSTGHTMKRLVNWNDLGYLLEDGPTHSLPSADMIQRIKKFNEEQALKWNYYIDIGRVVNNDPTNPQMNNSWPLQQEMINLANQYPNIPTSLITNRAQLNNPNCYKWVQVGASSNQSELRNGPCLRGNYKGNPPAYYEATTNPTIKFLQNSSGNVVNDAGQAIGNSAPANPVIGTTYNAVYQNRWWRPLYSASDPNLSSYYISDGNVVKDGINVLKSYLNRTIDINLVTDNGEIVAPYSDSVMNADPLVQTMKNATGISNNKEYWNKAFAEQEIASYRNPIMSALDTGSEYTLYKMSEPDDHTWNRSRAINTPITIGATTTNPSTMDFYPRYLSNWGSKLGAWIGMTGVSWQVKKGHDSGDKFFTPYVALTWDPNVTHGAPASQQIGALSNLVNMGAVSMYASYFHQVPDYVDGSGNPVVGYPQVKTIINFASSYAQAIYSRVQSLYENSDVMPGDIYCYEASCFLPASSNNKYFGYLFNDGHPNHWITVRKSNTSNKYIITGNINTVTTMQGAVPQVSKSTIKINGTPISFDIRPQGSTYVYDNTNTSDPIFYQLDGWHESSHPTRWSSDFAIEAELYDSGTATIKTEGNGVANRNFSNINGENYATYINPSTGTISYNFEPRYFDINNQASNGTPATWYLWFKAKSGSGTSTANVSVDGNNTKTISTNLNSYEWCNKDQSNAVISFSGITNNSNHALNFIGLNANFKMDKFLLTKNPNLNLGNCTTQVVNNIPPVLTLTNPTGGPSITSQVATLSGVAGTAVDSDGTVASVTWSNSVASAVVSSGTATGTNSWTIPSAIALSSGLNIITISATDDKGGVGTSTLSVTYTPPSDLSGPVVALTSPLNNANLTETVNLAATVTDVAGVGSVGFYYKQGTAPGVVAAGSVNSNGSNYTLAWNTSGITNGAYSLYVVAIDSLGNTTSTTPITVNINNVIINPDTTLPNITIINPITDQIISGSVNLQATASDPLVPNQAQRGVSFVKFEYKKTSETNYTNLGNSTGSNGIYNYAFDTVGLTNGFYNIKMTAVDGSDNSNSKSIIVSVNNSVAYPDLIVEQFNVNSVAPGTPITFSATIKNIGTVATPTNSSIHRVLFTVDGNSVTWSNNYTQSIAPGESVLLTANSGLTNATWTPTTAGTYQVVATVNDTGIIRESNTGNNSSPAQALIVSAAPSVSWVTPLNNSEVKLGETYELKVQTTGNVAYVKISKNLLSVPAVLNSTNNWAKPWKISPTAKEGKQVTWKAVGYDANNNPITSEVSTTVTRVISTQ